MIDNRVLINQVYHYFRSTEWICKSLLALAVTAIELSVPTVAHAFTSHLSSDQQLQGPTGLVTNGFAFVGEGRIGDLGGAGTFERDLGADTNQPATVGQYTWPNGTPVTFALTYDSGANLASYRVDDSTPLTYQPTASFTDIFIRTEAAIDNSSISIDNLVLNGVAIDDRASAAAKTPLDILRISDVAGSFTLTGRSTMSWLGDAQNPIDGTAPHQSQLAYQIKVGNASSPTTPTSVPEPTLTLALLAFGTFGGGWRLFKD